MQNLDFQKCVIVSHFYKPGHIHTANQLIRIFHVPNTLFCSNINAVLQIAYELQG